MSHEQMMGQDERQHRSLMASVGRRDVLALGAGGLATAGLSGIVSAGDYDDEDYGYDDEAPETEESVDDDLMTLFSAGGMTGDQHEEPIESSGAGAAAFQLSADETEIHYALVVVDLEDVTQAHIHEGTVGEAGDVVAWLFDQRDDEGRFTDELEDPITTNGVLATGTITEADLVGPYEDESLDTLVTGMRDETTYVNVHTVEHPPGEIRGQLHEVDDVEVEFDERVDARGGELSDVTTDVDLLVREDGEVVYEHAEEPVDDDSDGEPVTDVDETVTVGPGGDVVFDPDALSLQSGQTVEFVWESDGHNIAITDQPAGGDWEGMSELQNVGYSHAQTFTAEGEYAYVCEPHAEAGMDGTITVEADDAVDDIDEDSADTNEEADYNGTDGRDSGY